MNAAIKKIALGQFFTKNDFWLKDHILEFIKSTGARVAYDPFAGAGDMLAVAKDIGFAEIIGLDIDSDLNWKVNDSLTNIPIVEGSIILTNPPYLTNYSAKRKNIIDEVKKYFDTCDYDDLYQLAIDKCLNNQYGVMIVPETFINTNFSKNRLVSITIIESDLFLDTDNPVCVICFDGKNKSYDEIKMYKDSTYIGNLGHFEKMRLKPHKQTYFRFNVPTGPIALRAVDTTNPTKKISFMKPDEIDYDLSQIKHSSRLITLIDADCAPRDIDKIINIGNELLADFRHKTKDVLLSPFKGNMKNGQRRRRLDYQTARAILEQAAYKACPAKQLF